MKTALDLQMSAALPAQKVPTWARARGDENSDADAAYLAGAALNSLDGMVRSDALWLGVWRHRLALQATVAVTQILGRSEEESALRDVQFFRAETEDPGPAGRILTAWRRLADRSTTLDEEAVRRVAELVEVRWDASISDVVANAAEMLGSHRPAPIMAAEIAADLYRTRPDAEVLAFWVADAMLAQKLRWPIPVPLLASQMSAPFFKTGERRRRIRPGDTGWGRAVFIAYAKAATDACEMGFRLSESAHRLLEVAPKLRAKGSADVVRLLLDEDAVPGSWSNSKLSARGARRLFERLQVLGAVRELSGRSSFRLYGL